MSSDAAPTGSSIPPYTKEPLHQAPNKPYYVIEFPGHVKHLDKVFQTLGGLENITRAYNAPQKHSLDLRFRYEDPYSQAIQGTLCESSNLLLKVVRTVRRKKRCSSVNHAATTPEEPKQDPTTKVVQVRAELCGVIRQTTQFCWMADFQATSSFRDPLVQLKRAAQQYDLPTLLAFDPEQLKFPDGQGLQRFPQMFSASLGSPQLTNTYRYRQNKSLTKIYVPKFTNQPPVPVLVNQKQNHLSPFITITHTDPNIPQGPTATIRKHGEQIKPATLDLVREYFEKQLIWSRSEFLHKIYQDIQNRGIPQTGALPWDPKTLLSQFSYIIRGGTWNGLWIRYGYDPRTDPEARWEQRLTYHTTPRCTSAKYLAQSHSKDSPNLPSSTGVLDLPFIKSRPFSARSYTFRLADIAIPHIQRLLRLDNVVLSEYHPQSGRFHPAIFHYVRQYMNVRIKSFTKDPHACPHPPEHDEETTDDAAERALAETLLSEAKTHPSVPDNSHVSLTKPDHVSSQELEHRINDKVDQLMQTLATLADDPDMENEPDDFNVDFGDIYGSEGED
ncbi:tau 95 subunit of transcription factor TFIIIC [Dispira parvispora]|uniref:Tau 95 subunit of transcription factor TFIIIC n=1 Tax=Dispira parvispora TaxID=1520584 RepID=A0A9W8E0Y2_9FUNG|nr:tau 95 subunit of transcription factor TFIIIC [Dispira parvispora]